MTGDRESGVIKFEVPFSAPNTLYYVCQNHSNMGWNNSRLSKHLIT